MRLVAVATVAAISILGCSSVKTRQQPNNGLQSLVGTDVVLVGVADSRTGGAALSGDNFYVWLKNVPSWPANLVTKRVEVQGRLEVDHGLPVFVRQKNDPLPKQGISVTEGTDLREASKRYVLTHPTWTLLE